MTEYIDLKAAVDAVKSVIGDLVHECKSMMDFYSALWSVPAADVAPVVHGLWVKGTPNPYCSECFVECRDETPYRPNCGAKMDGGDSK